MEDEKDATVEEVKTEQDSTVEEVVDYDKELQEQVEKFEKKEQNRDGYAKRKAETKEEPEEPTDIDSQVEAAIAKALPKILPTLQSSLAEDAVETALNDLSGGNEAKKKLIKFHFENSVSPNGTIRERMENALLIADKKAILKKQSELALALKNRAGLGASGMGASTEGQTVPDNVLSADQLRDLKAKGWNDKKIERFKENLRR